jgi:hypothetical protein
LETTYDEGTKIVKSAKLQLLISKFEEIKMLEDETFKTTPKVWVTGRGGLHLRKFLA